jgi:uncharacterized protein YjbJ (UPF0337 family)
LVHYHFNSFRTSLNGLRLAALFGYRGVPASYFKFGQEAEHMNKDIVKGKLKQLAGEIKRKWGHITDDDLMQAEGSLDKLVGRIQERTGEQREAIEKWFKAQGCE